MRTAINNINPKIKKEGANFCQKLMGIRNAINPQNTDMMR